jgi:hypothetical protein
MNKLLKLNNHLYFWLLCVCSLFFAYLGDRFLFTESLFYSTLNEQFTNEQINILLNLREKWIGISYLLIPVFLIIRILYISFCLFLGDLFQETRWGYKRMFNIALKSDIVFVLSAISVFYYYLIFGNYSTTTDLSIHPFSLLAATGQENIPGWLVFAYNSINVFELIYLVFLTFLIHFSAQTGYIKALIFSLLTYGVGNYLYVIAITFLYLNFS